MTFARKLHCAWTALAAVPLLDLFSHGVGRRFGVCLGVYIGGGICLLIALARDPSGQALRRFAKSIAGRVAAVGVIAFIPLVAVARYGDFASVLIVLLVFATLLMALWALCPSAESLIGTTQNLPLLTGTVLMVAVAGEILFRLPPVVALTGGNRPGMLRWGMDQDPEADGNSRFRSFHLNEDKPPGTLRIVVLGDSYSWGDKIARVRDTWPYVLERLLDAPGHHVQVINLGVCGHTTVNAAEMLQREGWSREPDLVIVQFGLNDTLPSGPNFHRVNEEWFFRTRSLLPPFHRFLDSHSYLYSFLDVRLQALQIRYMHPDGFLPLFADDFFGWKDCQQALAKIGAECRQRRVPVAMVIFPKLVTGRLDEGSYPYLSIHQKVAAAAGKAGMRVLDLRPVYAQLGRPGRSWWAMPCDDHPNVEAHRVAAETLALDLDDLVLVSNANSDGSRKQNYGDHTKP